MTTERTTIPMPSPALCQIIRDCVNDSKEEDQDFGEDPELAEVEEWLEQVLDFYLKHSNALCEDAWGLDHETREGRRIQLHDENGLNVAWVLPMDGNRIIEALNDQRELRERNLVLEGEIKQYREQLGLDDKPPVAVRCECKCEACIAAGPHAASVCREHCPVVQS